MISCDYDGVVMPWATVNDSQGELAHRLLLLFSFAPIKIGTQSLKLSRSTCFCLQSVIAL